MKITDYQKVQTLDESNIVLIDGNNGTKTIMVTDFIKSLIGLTSSQDFISASICRNLRKSIRCLRMISY